MNKKQLIVFEMKENYNIIKDNNFKIIIIINILI
jgi:hypothetical protein